MHASAAVQRAIEGFVRLGYLAKALVYILIGVLALKVAAGVRGGRITDQNGALYVVLRQPMGRWLLLLVAIGLLAYSAWQLSRAIFGSRRRAKVVWWKGALVAVRALVYGAIGVQAMRLSLGLRGGGSGPEPLVRAALRWPGGEWVILIVGLGVGWYGIVQIADAYRGRLEPDLDAATLRRCAGKWALRFAEGGIAARGLLLAVLGLGLVRAAMKHRASEAGGLDESMVILNTLPQGTLLLAAAAAGVLAYGVYQLLHARYAQLR
jgi:hypothetical protein